MKIKVVTLPAWQGSAQTPEYVKEAYVGLILEAEYYDHKSVYYPEGFYNVDLNEFLAKIQMQSAAAHQWLAEQLGEIGETLDGEPVSISMGIPLAAECCRPIDLH